jgi:predicted ArsR family transcriptional regulator
LELAILILLARHGSLAYEQIAAHLREPPEAVRSELASLCDRGLVVVLAVGELEAHSTQAAASGG